MLIDAPSARGALFLWLYEDEEEEGRSGGRKKPDADPPLTGAANG
jgi:hypothetical protein